MLTRLVLATLAAFRLTVFLQRDQLTQRPREWFYDRFPPDSGRAQMRRVWLPRDKVVAVTARGDEGPAVSRWGQMAACPYCLGAWISLAVWAVMWALTPLPLPGLWPFAISAGVGLLAEMSD